MSDVKTVSNGRCTSGFFPVMTPLCLLCHKKIKTSDGMFYALVKPYYGVLHRHCAPFFSWNGEWPHAQPYVYYNNTGQNQQQTHDPGLVPTIGGGAP